MKRLVCEEKLTASADAPTNLIKNLHSVPITTPPSFSIMKMWYQPPQELFIKHQCFPFQSNPINESLIHPTTKTAQKTVRYGS